MESNGGIEIRQIDKLFSEPLFRGGGNPFVRFQRDEGA